MRMMAMLGMGLALAAAGPLPAWAAGPNDACVNQVNGAYDAVASQNWQAHFRNTDQNALQMIAEREEGTARLEDAVAAYRAALKVLTPGRRPLDWAKTQNSLGAALSTLGGREEGTAHLEESVAVYQAALEVYVRDELPFQLLFRE